MPEMMRGLGQGVREFKKGVNDVNPGTENNPENSESDDNLENPEDGEKQE